MRNRNKHFCIALSLFLGFFFLCYAIFFHDRIRFYFFTKNLIQTEMEHNTLSLHYSLAYPEKYGFHLKAALPLYQSQGTTDSVKTYQALSSISKKKLSSSQADTYDLLQQKLIQDIQGDSFPFYQEPFSANSGIQSSLPILLADYSFRKKQDVDDYLSLLDQTDDYFNSLLAYEQKKLEEGLFMADCSADKVILACQSILTEKQLKEGNHFLQLTFEERITDMVQKKLLSEDEAADYCAENDRLLIEVVAPAYQCVADTFSRFKQSSKNSSSQAAGLFYLPKGKAYYEYLLASETGSSRPISEIKRMLYQDFQTNYAALLQLLQTYPALMDSDTVASLELQTGEPTEILKTLADLMAEDFPAFPAASSPLVHVKSVPASMEAYTSPAYYLTPPIDDMLNNVIYINHKSTEEGLSLFTTLAHEGYPGHLYQTVYSQLYQKESHAPLIRSFFHYGGFVEGYALYVENMSYDYAKVLTDGNELQAACFEANRLNRNLHLCLYSLLDIAIHYDGASILDVENILQKAGVTNPAATKAIYEYIVEEPANYPKYYLGYLEILELKKIASQTFPDDFNLKTFHQFLVEEGPADFDTLHQKLSETAVRLSASDDSPVKAPK